ncbi:MAG: glycoside hydrolase family 113 [Bryobacteraceae bacterium]
MTVSEHSAEGNPGTAKLRAACFGALAAAAFFYPAYWLAMFTVRALPACLKVIAGGETFLWFRCAPMYVAAVSRPEGQLVLASRSASEAPLLTMAAVFAAALLAFAAPTRHRWLSGLFIACLGQVAIGFPLARWAFQPQATLQTRLGTVVYALVLLFGLWRLLSGWAGMGPRLATGIVGFLLPLSLFIAQAARSLDARFALFGLGPALLATGILATFRPAGSPGIAPGWRGILAGVAASLLVFGGAHAAGSLERRSKQAGRASTLASIPKPDPAQPYPRWFFQKGVNFTAEGPTGYSPRESAAMLDHLARNGVNSIALVPYGFTPAGQPAVRFGNAWERDEDIRAVTALAHQRGIKVMLKPQVWLHRGWPADIHFDAAGDRRLWFDSYVRFLEHYAKLAAQSHADLLCVGTEFGRMSRYEDEWRRIIRRARELYSGPLVYAAVQGPEFEGIRFWDALDYIGLNNYYPLPDNFDLEPIVQKVEAVQSRFQRPVIFTEAGFASLKAPHRAPWDESPRDLSVEDQARCYEAVLKAFYGKPWFSGVYWWKVGTNGFGGPEDGSHTPWGKPAMEVIARWYTQGGR